MPTIVISYRREDTGLMVGRICDRLRDHYGVDQVMMDIDSIPLGLDFRKHLRETLDRCDTMLAVIGPSWAALDERGQSRLADETDWVRIEIETALAKDIPVIPVLINEARMPKPRDLPDMMRDLAFRQATEVDMRRDFHSHMDRLIRVMDQLLAQASSKSDATTDAEGVKAESGKRGEAIRPAEAKAKTRTPPRTALKDGSEQSTHTQSETAPPSVHAAVLENRTLFNILGIVLILLGGAAIALSFLDLAWRESVGWTGLGLGWLFLIGGIVQIVHAFLTRQWRGFPLDLIIGVLYLVGFRLSGGAYRACRDVHHPRSA